MKTTRALIMLIVIATALLSCKEKHQNKTTENVSKTDTIKKENLTELVTELTEHIADHGMPENAEDFYTEEYYYLLEKTWKIMAFYHALDYECMYYFIESNGGCPATPPYNHKVNIISTKNYGDSMTVEFDYIHSIDYIDRHTIRLKRKDERWIISDWDNTKELMKEIINETFHTPDLGFAEAIGDVKRIEYLSSKEWATFDRDGNLTAYKTDFAETHNIDKDGNITEVPSGGNATVKIERKNGYITSISDDSGMKKTIEYDDYNPYLRAITDESGRKEYVDGFDKNFRITFYKRNEKGEIEKATDAPRSEILKYDDHGNWTKRKLLGTIEERKIEYYNPIIFH